MTRFLLTGATGFLGREVVVRLLGAGHEVMVASRARGDESLEAAQSRLTKIMSDTASEVDTSKLVVAFGDVTREGLGLDEKARGWLNEGPPVHVVHGAAQVRFDLPYEEMERQNVGGTRNMLGLATELAESGQLVRFDYVSTAYVAGTRKDVAPENEIDVGQKTRNSYERSKLAAETVVAEATQSGLPTTVHRPSIIVGDSRTGKASSFKVLYWPMRLYARGRWRTCFGRRDCTMDIVPVDFVADAMVHLFSKTEAVGRTFHLAAGAERQSTIGELCVLAQRFFGGKPIRYFDPYIYHRYLRWFLKPMITWVKPDVGRSGGVFLPYLIQNPTFSTTGADELLAPAKIEPPSVVGYFDTIMRYAKESNFGEPA